jgi:hypothetical protein
MSPGHDLPSPRRPSAGRAGSQPLTAADTEWLLAGHGALPEAATTHHLLADLLDSAAGPGSDQELAGEVAAVAAFVLVSGGRAPRSARFRGAGATGSAGGAGSTGSAGWSGWAGSAGSAGRRGPVIAAGIAAAVVVGLSGAAAADALPAPIQELAHVTFGAPAPLYSVPLPRATVPSGSPVPVTSPGAKSQPAKGNAKGKAKGKAKPSEKPSPNGLTHGKKNGKAVPPGHQKA